MIDFFHYPGRVIRLKVPGRSYQFRPYSIQLTVVIGVRDRGRHEAGVSGLLRAAVGQLYVCLLEVPQLGGRYGGRRTGRDPRLEALEVRQLKTKETERYTLNNTD